MHQSLYKTQTTQGLSLLLTPLKRTKSYEYLLKSPKQKTISDQNRYEKYCCGHTTRAKYFTFLIDLQKIAQKINLNLLISYDESQIFHSIKSSVQACVDRILLIEKRFSTEQIVDFNNFVSSLAMKEAKLRSEEEILKIGFKEVENIEKILFGKEERLRVEHEKINFMMKVLRTEQMEMEQIRIKCLRLQNEVDIYKLNEPKNTYWTEESSEGSGRRKNTIYHKVSKNPFIFNQKVKDSNKVSKNLLTMESVFTISLKRQKNTNISLKLQELELRECIINKTEQELKEYGQAIIKSISDYNKELESRESILKTDKINLEKARKDQIKKQIELKLVQDHLKNAKEDLQDILKVIPEVEQCLKLILENSSDLREKSIQVFQILSESTQTYHKVQESLSTLNSSSFITANIPNFSAQDSIPTSESLISLSQELQEKLQLLQSKEKEIELIKSEFSKGCEENESTLAILKILKLEFENSVMLRSGKKSKTKYSKFKNSK